MDSYTKYSLKELREEIDARIANTLTTCPTITYVAVAKQYKVSRDWVLKVAKQCGITRPRGRKPNGKKEE